MAQLAPPSPNSRPTSAYSYTPSQSYNLPRSPRSPTSPDSDSDADSDLPLPFPAALSRADFLAPDFDAAAYLSALHTGGPASRHQTLEDLRAELRERSAAISAELLELVNANYTAFLGLGDGLKGGEDRVGDVRVALLGFRRAVEEIQGRVRERRVEVGRVNAEVAGVKTAVECGRRMLELDERVAGLERRLAVGSAGEGGKKGSSGQEEDEDWGDDFDSAGSEEEEDEEEDGVELVSSGPVKLTALAKEYVFAEQIAESIGRDLPFVRKMEERMARCRNTILLDLSTALREARKAGPQGQGRILKYLGIYRILDAQDDAVKVLKGK
ncbi:oligomeric golgi complex component, COG2-domain-containing protein [Chaetomium tenue]|uniref:Oligomeric golgi complex component, COG2-domain-containing protein n=1 Tax=Chaetomium tenue TaxID=1854479 RepID=A0ACB7PMT2_9PEZI|nr:oligomeric golgi complex component, COG2-domain-containing protein [Chaetomium globosum]